MHKEIVHLRFQMQFLKKENFLPFVVISCDIALRSPQRMRQACFKVIDNVASLKCFNAFRGASRNNKSKLKNCANSLLDNLLQ